MTNYPGSPIPGMSYSDAKDAVIRVMQCIADNQGLSDAEFDSIGYTVDVLFALGFRSHMLDEATNGMPAVWLSSLR